MITISLHVDIIILHVDILYLYVDIIYLARRVRYMLPYEEEGFYSRFAHMSCIDLNER